MAFYFFGSLYTLIVYRWNHTHTHKKFKYVLALIFIYLIIIYKFPLPKTCTIKFIGFIRNFSFNKNEINNNNIQLMRISLWSIKKCQWLKISLENLIKLSRLKCSLKQICYKVDFMGGE